MRRRPHVAEPKSETTVGDALPSQASQASAQGDQSSRTPVATMSSGLLNETLPQLLAVGGMLSLIFGGCCSNVFALENIIKVEPTSGTLLTFVQFVFVAITSFGSQFDSSRPPFFLKPNKVPLARWMINILLFFSINVLNNHAFSYDISVPVHIILRSGGSITTILAGYAYGKRYSRVQVLAVVLLTGGVITAAWSDAQTKALNGPHEKKVNEGTARPPVEDSSDFGMGLVILFVAQVMSAVMGLYTEATYRKYGPHWKENLFYSHLLSIPLFLPFAPGLVRQVTKLTHSPPFNVAVGMNEATWVGAWWISRVPSQLVYLVLNVLTQYVCIRGVNLLAAASTALTVTIVLNIRKLVSLLLSIWLFGHRLATGTLVGAIVVFSAGALYSLDSRNGKRSPAPATSKEMLPKEEKD
ncbi:hypothetical protein MKZ38_002906 [Zalerion maritima]|uniref:Uncharacterized protein n=1 Tax=Zalerion maritima TaxID=339359 RepID=A0AAD5RPP3_9PEZI|nr:hypothetical protein MKZ38_002906 [Zalerion maritima]